MNARAYAWGVAYVFLTMAAAVVSRAWGEARILTDYGIGYLPHFLIASALSFIVASATYDALARRVRLAVLDASLMALLGALAVITPTVQARGGAAPFVMALLLIGVSQAANLAAWNGVAATVAGRTARRYLPRAGAAVTAGGVVAGFGSSALVVRLGVSALPMIVAGLSVTMVAVGLGLGRALKAGGAPGAAAPAPAQGVAPAAATTKRAPLSVHAKTLVVWLCAAAFLEAAASAVVEFMFASGLRTRFPDSRELAAALAAFYGATSAVLLLLQLLAVPRILVTRSLPFTASLHPSALLLGLGALFLSPALAVVATVRTIDAIFKPAASRTSQEVSLSVLGPDDRQRWKVLLRGVVAPLGAATAGATLFFLLRGRLDARVLVIVPTVLTFAWLYSVRRSARAFVTNLGAPLGMKRIRTGAGASRAVGLDLDELLRLIERAGDPDPETARLARAALVRAGHNADELAPWFDHEDPAVRAALFGMAAWRPHPAARAELRAALTVEHDAAAIAACLRALAAHDDDSAIARARELQGDGGVQGTASRAYLAERGQLDAADAERALRAVLPSDGIWAGRIGARLGATLAWPDGDAPALERYRCVILAGGPEALARLRADLDAGEPAAAVALRAPRECLARVGTLLAGASPRVRVRIARALASSRFDEATHTLGLLLDDDDATVRDAAARALAWQRRERDLEVNRPALERALDREQDLLGRYVAARAPAGVRPPLHEAELERQARRCVARILALVALDADPATIAAAGRRLRSKKEMERRRALDLLQEVAAGRPALLAPLERYLTPVSAAPGEEACTALVAADPWLRRLFGGEVAALAPRLEALRANVLFDDLPPDELEALAAESDERSAAAGETVVREGDAADSMYVVLSGKLIVERGVEKTVTVTGSLAAPQSFGELGLIDDAPRSATVRAESACRLLRLPRPVFQAVLERCPEVGLGMLRALAAWLRTAHT